MLDGDSLVIGGTYVPIDTLGQGLIPKLRARCAHINIAVSGSGVTADPHAGFDVLPKETIYYLLVGINNLLGSSPTTAAGIFAALNTVGITVKAAGVWKAVCSTVFDSSALSGAQQTQRGLLNTALRAGLPTGFDALVDLDAVPFLQDPANFAEPDGSGDGITHPGVYGTGTVMAQAIATVLNAEFL